MKRSGFSRILSVLLAFVMIISMTPSSVLAAEPTTCELVTNVDDLAVGDRVVVVAKDYDYALGTNQKSNNREAVAVTKDGNTVTISDTVQVLTLENGTKEGTYALYTDKGYLYAASSGSNYLRTEEALSDNSSWNIEIAEDGNATIKAQGTNTRNWMRYNPNNGTPIFACYGANQQDICLYKLTGTVTPPNPDPEPEPDPDPVAYSTIAEALAGENGTEFTVKGVVTLVDGLNIYVQDATGGICLRFGSKPADVTLGDTVIGTGTRAVYNGLAQLSGAVGEKSSGLTLTAKETTIGALTTADVCTYVKISSLEITEIYDNNGQYSSPNITVKDENGNSIQLYKAIVDKTDDGSWALAVGDKINVTAAVGIYNTTLQLRNTLSSEIEKDETPVDPQGPLADGDRVVIYNPANMKALSQNYTGNYNAGVDVRVADGVLSGFSATEVWTVGVNADGTYTFSTADGKKLSMGGSYTSMPLDGVNPNWEISEAKTEGCFYIKNTVRGAYIEWYASKGNWSSYYTISDTNEALFAQTFYKVTGDIPDTGSLPKDGDQVVIYNVSAEGVLAGQNDNTDSPSINGVAASVKDGKASAGNGARVFTVEVNGDYLRFKNEYDGYLCSNGTGNNAYYSQTASEDADWKLEAYNGGFSMESRTAKFNGKYSQYLEYYADSYKTYSMYNVTDADIYTFQFYPVAEGVNVTEGVVNQPAAVFGTVLDAYVGQDYTLTFTVDSVFGVDGDLTVTLGDTALTYAKETDGSYSVTIPDELFVGKESFTVAVSGKDTKGIAITGSAVVAVKDEPVISNETPKSGSETLEDKRPVISAEISNAGENPAVTMTVNGETVGAVWKDGKISYQAAADMVDGRVTVTVTVKRADGKEASKSWSFTVGKSQYQLYFGQLHSHTQYSDGSGSLEAALDYVASLPESANVDFVAFTDHSNYFDQSGAANPEGAIYDMSLASEYSRNLWNTYKSTVAAFNEKQSDIVAIAGFEMTWSGGPGHINTFNTEGIVSRNNTTLNNKTDYAGMKAYYALLSQTEGVDGLSQFNHPGSTFGTFGDFAFWDPVIDSRIFMVEVGNGEGQVGAGGYYPSYEYYIMALDKGWHVAPTNNQDNHKGRWGNANDARDVIITDDFSETGIYQAIRDMRMYATEDKNLEIGYTVNGQLLGSSITEVPEKLNIEVTVNDPDVSDSISKVEVVVNSGKTVYTWDDPAVLATGSLSVELDPDYSYYFIRVTEGDGDLAVTAPVWVGESLKLGISSVECGTSTPVTGEALTLTTTLFNSESADAEIKSVTYTSNGSQVIGTDTDGYTLSASGTLAVEFEWTPEVAKLTTVTVTVVMEQDGKEYIFTKDISLDILDANELVYIGIDASHYNEYVAGNYKDSMGNFGNLAAEYSMRTVELKTSEDLIAACSNSKFKMLILTVPSRRDGTSLRNPYATYSEEEIAAIVEFNKNGGVVVLAGWSDYYENYGTFPAEDHMAAQQNKLLAALGSSLRIGDDATNDDSLNGGQTQRLYFNTYNFDNFLNDGVEVDDEHPNDRLYTEVFSHYGGASIYTVDAEGNASGIIPETVSPVVYGHSSTYSKDSDEDGIGGASVPKYTVAEGDTRLMIMASEQLDGKGLIIVSGAAFMSNFEVQATVEDNGSEKNYSNYRICENLLSYVNPIKITDIAEVQKQTEEGFKYTIEGIVTSNASGYDKDTAFFDCIYVQDATGGICCFPVAGDYKIGDKVRITGTTDFYQGEMELQVTAIEKLGEETPIVPLEVTAAQINDGSVLGSLVTIKGVVVSFEKQDGLVQTIMVKDAEGNVARVFIDGYITTSKEVKNLAVGAEITATGLASYDDTFNAPDGPFPRIRVRDRDDVVCGDVIVHEHQFGEWTVTVKATCTTDGMETRTCACGETETRVIKATGHSFGEWIVTKKATETAAGTKERVCSVCGCKETQSIPATGSASRPSNPSKPSNPSNPSKADTNPTGDTANPMLWGGLLAASAVILLAAVLLTKKRKTKES